jgi:hypothetical protein
LNNGSLSEDKGRPGQESGGIDIVLILDRTVSRRHSPPTRAFGLGNLGLVKKVIQMAGNAFEWKDVERILQMAQKRTCGCHTVFCSSSNDPGVYARAGQTLTNCDEAEKSGGARGRNRALGKALRG